MKVTVENYKEINSTKKTRTYKDTKHHEEMENKTILEVSAVFLLACNTTWN